MKLGYHQQEMLDFVKRHKRTSLGSDWLSVKVAKSLEKRGLIRLIDCGMSTNAGRTVYLVELA